MTSFAEQLSAARKAAGMTQEELAEAVHVARNTISNWERGQRQPDLEMVHLLSQALHTDLMRPDIFPEAEADTEKPAEEEAVAPETASVEEEAGPRKRNRLYLVAAAALLVLVLLGIFVFGPALRNPLSLSVPDNAGTRYAVSDYNQTTPNEADKAYLSIVRTLSVRPGDGKDFYAINFTVREDNGIAFSIDRLEMIIFFSDHADPFIFSHDDLASAGYEPDIPAYGFLSLDNGFPTDQKGLKGMGMRIMGKDANGAERTFTAYQPIP